MTSRIAQTVSALRSYLVLSILVLALAAGSQAASAGTSLPSGSDDDSPGAVSFEKPSGTMLEQLGLVPTNDGPGSFLTGPTLVGSGPERELVANGQETASGSIDETERALSLIDLTDGGTTASAGTLDEESQKNVLIALGAGNPTATSGTLDETARSVDLIALSDDADGEYAEAPGLAPR